MKYFYKVVLKEISSGKMFSIFDGTTIWNLGKWARGGRIYFGFETLRRTKETACKPHWWSSSSRLVVLRRHRDPHTPQSWRRSYSFVAGYTPVILRCIGKWKLKAHQVYDEIEVDLDQSKVAYRMIKPVSIVKWTP